MTRRALVLGLLAWVAVVAAGSGVTWVVIDAAGQQVLSDAPVPVVPAARPTPSAAASPSASPHGSRHPRPSRPATPSAAPSAATTPPAPTTSPTPVPASSDATWRGGAGTVVARCTGSSVSLVSATPSNGYRVEIGSRGPAEVEVTFMGDNRQTQVKAHCSGGAPQFGTETGAPADD